MVTSDWAKKERVIVTKLGRTMGCRLLHGQSHHLLRRGRSVQSEERWAVIDDLYMHALNTSIRKDISYVDIWIHENTDLCMRVPHMHVCV